jgi:TonB-dependent SusC/RagA subfamily outer membrane receptor
MNKILITFSLIFSFFTVFSQEKKVTIFWDTSYSMIDKELSNEMGFLNSYFKTNTKLTLNLIKFSNQIISNESFEISNSDWGLLKKELINTVYDGASSFETIKEIILGDEILFFTDGNGFIDDFPTVFLKPVKIISSTPDSNKINLKKVAELSKGLYFDLSEKEFKKTKKNLDVFINGIVQDATGPLSGVNIVAKLSKNRVVTNDKGEYSIKLSKEDVLLFSYPGKNTLRVLAKKNVIKDVLLTDGTQILDEIVIVSELKEQVNTGNALENKDKIGYSVQTIGEKDISQMDTDVKQAVKGQFSGLKIQNNTAQTRVDLSQFIGRGNNMTITGNQYGLIVLDGVPLSQSNSSGSGYVSPTDFVNPDNIKNITYLKGLAATNKYGTRGANGVLLITTKTGSPSARGKVKKDIELGTTPTYNEDANFFSSSLASKPYVKALQKSKTIEQAYSNYLIQRKKYGKTSEYFINVAIYFKNWNNPYMLKRILSNVLELKEGAELETLLALVYRYEEYNMFDEANRIYQKAIKTFPENSQLYRNLALNNIERKEYKKAQQTYNIIDKNGYDKVSSFSGLKKTINYEYKNLVALHKNKLTPNSIPGLYTNNIKFNTRIVFEWNAFDAEFDLQIVNPQNRYFTWSHTKKAEPNRILKEKQQGFGLEEFFITSNDKGEWLFNISYFGKITGDISLPVYLKVTVFRNFGERNQTKETKIISLEELNDKINILTISI